jgi:myxalamid-type polyketide synthase MxaC
VAFRGGQRFAPRLVAVRPRAAEAPRFLEDAAYLVTGGLGDLGLHLAGWLADRGARHLVLVGRNGLPPRDSWADLPAESRERRQVDAVLAMERRGARVLVAAADVADAAAMTSLVGRFGEELPSLRGVFHAAGVMPFDNLAAMNADRIGAVLRPKVGGAWTLHRLTSELELDHFVMFGSVAGVWGSRGMAHYAAANQFLAGLAHHRRAAGMPALTVDWGGWAGGDASRDANRFLARSDFILMPPVQALDAMGLAMADGVAERLVAGVDWASLRTAYEADSARPLFREIARPNARVARSPSPEPAASAPLVDRLRRTGDSEALDLVTTLVRGEVAAVLGVEEARLTERGQGFFKLGMDSLMTVELRARLERTTGLSLPTTIAFEFPTVEALSGYLSVRLAPPPAAEPAGTIADPAADPIGPASFHAPDADLDAMSEDELAAMLDGTLADLLDDGTTTR